MLCTTVLLVLVVIYQAQGGCYPTGAHCVPSKPYQTKVTWHSCQEYCNKCKGLSMGDCVKTFTPLCNGKFQCKCSGHTMPTSRLSIDQVTCLMGV